jgi:hypothetical protein
MRRDLSLRSIWIDFNTEIRDIESIIQVVSDFYRTDRSRRRIDIHCANFDENSRYGTYKPVVVQRAKRIQETFSHPRAVHQTQDCVLS